MLFLNPPALQLAKRLVRASPHAWVSDRHVLESVVRDDAGLAVPELLDRGFLVRNGDACHFASRFFWELDSLGEPPVLPIPTSLRVMQAALSPPLRYVRESADIARRLALTPRRFNPALQFLIDLGAVRPLSHRARTIDDYGFEHLSFTLT